MSAEQQLEKAATGIAGLDEITEGGLPAGRSSLVCGGPGCGKTALAMEFVVRGARDHGEPGVFVSFEEKPDALIANFSSLGFDLPGLKAEDKLHITHVDLSPAEVLEAGAFSLEGLFIRLQNAIARIGAKRVALDTLEALFAYLGDTRTLRRELARLVCWLEDQGVTSIFTGERGDAELTRDGLQEYVSDCVILLDHRVSGHIAKRRLRIVKYRGTRHGTDEYPFLISDTGVSVFPITSVTLDDVTSDETVSSGVPDLDAMLGRGGHYRGTKVLVSGTAGTGKSTLAAAFASASCARGERCLYFAFEESKSQILRNMRSVGIDLAKWIDRGRLHIEPIRPTYRGLEEHLVSMVSRINDYGPKAVVIDPISNFINVGQNAEVKSMLIRMFDHLHSGGATVLATDLTSRGGAHEGTDVEVSSIMDTWIVVRRRLKDGRRRRELHVVKSRGMDCSLDVRELVLDSTGVSLRDLDVDGET